MRDKYKRKLNSVIKTKAVLLLVLALVVGTFAGCGDDKDPMEMLTGDKTWLDSETTSSLGVGYETDTTITTGEATTAPIVETPDQNTTSSVDSSGEQTDTTTEPTVEQTDTTTESTTKPPESTTRPSESTTEPTTKPPATTTKPPATTTKPPATTTKPPATTTKPPVTTTRPPETTTEQPTTKPPVVDYNVDIKEPVASGTAVSDMNGYVIDYSNMQDGYVMVKANTTATAVVQIYLDSKSGTLIGQYFLKVDNAYMAFPLTKGANTYCVRVLEQKSTGGYVQKNAITQYAAISPETKAYIQPNMYVAYNLNSTAVRLSCELCAGKTSNEEKVKAIYDYIVNNIDYDYEFAKTVAANGMVGYMDAERCLKNKKGICGDYSVLFATMCRAQGIPCMVVEGYVTTSSQIFHAWNKVYLNGQWKFYDTTFDAGGGTGKNYIEVYFY